MLLKILYLNRQIMKWQIVLTLTPYSTITNIKFYLLQTMINWVYVKLVHLLSF